MLDSPADHAIKTIEFLNVNNAILSKTNAQLVTASRARKQTQNSKRVISKARCLDKDDADKLYTEIMTKEAAEIAHRDAVEQKKKEQALKKAQEKAEKAERAQKRAIVKDTRETNVEMTRMAKIDRRLFT